MGIKIELCFDNLPTWFLKKLLRNDLMNMESPFLTDDAIIHICEILVERENSEGKIKP